MGQFQFTHNESGKVFTKLDITIIIPIHNEAANLPQLFAEIISTMEKGKSYEIIAVNDGSEDNSQKVLLDIFNQYPHVNIQIINFTRNYGQTSAISCGIANASGAVIILIDADLQNDPADITRLIQKLDQGFDVVSGWRKNRKDAWLRVIPSKMANWAINRMIASTKVYLHDYGCSLKAYRKDVIKNIKLYGEMHRYIPAFAGWLGAKVGELEVNHRPRIHGVSHYGMGRVWRVILDLIVVRFFVDAFSKPMQFFGKYIVYLTKIFIGTFILMIVVKIYLFPKLLNFNSFILTVGFFLLAIQNLVSMGLLGEILIRNYLESLNKDIYVIDRIISRAPNT